LGLGKTREGKEANDNGRPQHAQPESVLHLVIQESLDLGLIDVPSQFLSRELIYAGKCGP
jgi:hypothetical protein